VEGATMCAPREEDVQAARALEQQRAAEKEARAIERARRQWEQEAASAAAAEKEAAVKEALRKERRKLMDAAAAEKEAAVKEALRKERAKLKAEHAMALAAKAAEAAKLAKDAEAADATALAAMEAAKKAEEAEATAKNEAKALKCKIRLLCEPKAPPRPKSPPSPRCVTDTLTTIDKAEKTPRVGRRSHSFSTGQHAAPPLAAGITNEELSSLLAQREAARNARNWHLCDSLRAQLHAKHIYILDARRGSPGTWSSRDGRRGIITGPDYFKSPDA